MAEKALRPVPEGMNTITAHLWFAGNCLEAIDFYKKAFDAKLVSEIFPRPDGKSVWRAIIRIDDSNIMLADAEPGSEERWADDPKSELWIYVENCDQMFSKAVEKGCKEIDPLKDTFWGDRYGKLKDPFGHYWVIATYKWVFTSEEMKTKERELLTETENS